MRIHNHDMGAGFNHFGDMETKYSSGGRNYGGPGGIEPDIGPIYPLQPGEHMVNGQFFPVGFDEKKMPSRCCPLLAFLCCWPLGIASSIFYFNALSAIGRCFTCPFCNSYV